MVNSLLNAISGAPLINYLEGINLLSNGNPEITLNEIEVQVHIDVALQGSIPGGPIYIEWDSHLDRLFGKSAYLQQGAFNNAGRAIVADRRFPERSNALGILLNKDEDSYAEGQTVFY